MSYYSSISSPGAICYLAILVILLQANDVIKSENHHKFHRGQVNKNFLIKHDIDGLKLDKCGQHVWPKKKASHYRSTEVEPLSNDGYKRFFANRRISHGTEAKLKQFPSFIRIELFNTSHPNHYTLCGGTLVARDLVITAGHCIIKSHNIARLTAGVVRWDPKLPEEVKDKQQVYARKICIHKDFRHPQNQTYIGKSIRDLAVIQLERKFNLSASVQPACLPQKLDINNESMYTIGMGQIDHDESSEVLNYVPVAKEEKCTYSDTQWDSCYTPTPIGEICYGDSGSGLILVKGQRQYLAGVTSSNTVDECSLSRKTPSVYSDVVKEKAQILELLQYCYEKN